MSAPFRHNRGELAPAGFLFPALVALCLPGCGLPDRNLSRKLTTADVTGTWRLTAASLALLNRDGFKGAPEQRYTIVLKKDGQLNFASVISDFHTGTYMECQGTWNLGHDTRESSGLRVANTLRMRLKTASADRFTGMGFAETDGRLVLWDFYGDPDSWEFIEYERTPQE
jgi:hypothetical protein